MKSFLPLLTLLLLLTGSHLNAQVVADAGVTYTMICPGANFTLGGTPTATGGNAPYTYSWTPATGLNSATAANPVATPAGNTQYILTVSDADGNTDTDTITIDINPIAVAGGGNDTFVCTGGQVQLGLPTNDGSLSYAWSPAASLSSTSDPRPVATPTVTTTYSVTITSTGCTPVVNTVLVTVQPIPVITVSPTVITILEGQTAILTASGGSSYYWSPPDGLSNSFNASVSAEPTDTTTYLLAGFDEVGCPNYTSVTVNVVPNREIFLYNSFSPNNDGINDFFYVGNIYKYPNCRLEVFDRTGQLVYSKGNYDNSWDGTNYGDRLPDATYYYVLDLGDGSPKIYDSVTIVR
ncbi:MAG: gliding motility-associated C-terminal domain-containing protein [Bacteroidia bacterium]|nr:gliding motility-associated C-terminal domain-containing protein [Bacteroidia bacterium]